MFWWVVLALVVLALALLWYRGRTRAGGSSSLDQAALTRARRDRKRAASVVMAAVWALRPATARAR